MSTNTPADPDSLLKALDAPENHHLQDYEKRYQSFRWEDIYDEFDWSKTGKVNMAHEAIDRHLTRGRRNKLALVYTDKDRTERFTFEDMSQQSNRFANVLRKLGVGKGDCVFVFLGRRPELYIAIPGGACAAVRPAVFEAHYPGGRGIERKGRGAEEL